MIRLALNLLMTSRSAYEALRDAGVLRLPSSRTLYDYSHAITSVEGISEGILKMAKSKVQNYQKSHQSFVTVMADEMHVSKNLVYRAADGQMVGFTNLDQVDMEIEQLEKELR